METRQCHEGGKLSVAMARARLYVKSREGAKFAVGQAIRSRLPSVFTLLSSADCDDLA